MLSIKRSLILFSALVCGFNIFGQELLTSKPNVTIDELYNKVNFLITNMTEENKLILRKEVDAMAFSNNEDQMHLASNIYSRALGEPRLAEKTKESLLKLFPRGKIARSYEHGAVFGNKELNIATLEKKYQEWLNKFPPENFSPEDQDIYIISQMYFAERYAKAGLIDKSKTSITKTKDSRYFVETVLKSYLALGLDQQDMLLDQLEDAYTYSVQRIENEKDSKRKESNKRQFVALSLPLAEKWVEMKQYDRALSSLNNPLVAASEEYDTMLKRTLLISKAYSQTGKDEEALMTYGIFLSKHGEEDQVLQHAKALYQKLHTGSGNFDQYVAGLLAQNTNALYDKYKAEMIKEAAPPFNLMDTDGKYVSLSNYKGKVVVLDFWATWCVPCIRSFPGMQAAVTKYSSDPEVVFLFIDTWQREENYKEVVKTFLKDNPYTFHVLFDEMRDAPKSVATAYKLPGIPTKVIIDKEGYIRFQSSGSEVVIDKLVKELDVKIDLAKKASS